MGAKGKYEDWIHGDGLIKVAGWARDGLTDDDIAHNMGIGKTALYDWKRKFPQFAQALKRSKEVADIIVENALFKSACGYDYEEVSTETDAYGRVKKKITTKHVQPSTVAQIFWLKNRRPDKWRDKPIVGYSEEAESDGLLDAIKEGNDKLFEGVDDFAAMVGDE